MSSPTYLTRLNINVPVKHLITSKEGRFVGWCGGSSQVLVEWADGSFTSPPLCLCRFGPADVPTPSCLLASFSYPKALQQSDDNLRPFKDAFPVAEVEREEFILWTHWKEQRYFSTEAWTSLELFCLSQAAAPNAEKFKKTLCTQWQPPGQSAVWIPRLLHAQVRRLEAVFPQLLVALRDVLLEIPPSVLLECRLANDGGFLCLRLTNARAQTSILRLHTPYSFQILGQEGESWSVTDVQVAASLLLEARSFQIGRSHLTLDRITRIVSENQQPKLLTPAHYFHVLYPPNHPPGVTFLLSRFLCADVVIHFTLDPSLAQPQLQLSRLIRGDIDIATEIAQSVPEAQSFLPPSPSQNLFADPLGKSLARLNTYLDGLGKMPTSAAGSAASFRPWNLTDFEIWMFIHSSDKASRKQVDADIQYYSKLQTWLGLCNAHPKFEEAKLFVSRKPPTNTLPHLHFKNLLGEMKMRLRLPPVFHLGDFAAASMAMKYVELHKGTLLVLWDGVTDRRVALSPAASPPPLNYVDRVPIARNKWLTQVDNDRLVAAVAKLAEARLVFCDPRDPEAIHNEQSQRSKAPYREDDPKTTQSRLNGKSKLKTLRAKLSHEHPNIRLRDPVILTISNGQYYPSKALLNVLVDKEEGITHAMETDIVDAELSHWIRAGMGFPYVEMCMALRVEFPFYPTDWNDLVRFVELKLATDWSDPILPTIEGLARRGVDLSKLKEFVVKNATSQAAVSVDLFQFFRPDSQQEQIECSYAFKQWRFIRYDHLLTKPFLLPGEHAEKFRNPAAKVEIPSPVADAETQYLRPEPLSMLTVTGTRFVCQDESSWAVVPDQIDAFHRSPVADTYFKGLSDQITASEEVIFWSREPATLPSEFVANKVFSKMLGSFFAGAILDSGAWPVSSWFCAAALARFGALCLYEMTTRPTTEAHLALKSDVDVAEARLKQCVDFYEHFKLQQTVSELRKQDHKLRKALVEECTWLNPERSEVNAALDSCVKELKQLVKDGIECIALRTKMVGHPDQAEPSQVQQEQRLLLKMAPVIHLLHIYNLNQANPHASPNQIAIFVLRAHITRRRFLRRLPPSATNITDNSKTIGDYFFAVASAIQTEAANPRAVDGNTFNSVYDTAFRTAALVTYHYGKAFHRAAERRGAAAASRPKSGEASTRTNADNEAFELKLSGLRNYYVHLTNIRLSFKVIPVIRYSEVWYWLAPVEPVLLKKRDDKAWFERELLPEELKHFNRLLSKRAATH